MCFTFLNEYTYLTIFQIHLNLDILLNEMNVLNSHIMLGDSILFIPNLNKLDSDYLGYFPNCNFNNLPEGNAFVNYIQDRKVGQFKDLIGGYLDINLFLREI